MKIIDIYTLTRYPTELISHKLAHKLIKRKINIRDTIIVSGTPRGGTTWFMELLETLPDYKSIFEPLHKDWFPLVKKLNLPSRPYLEPNAEKDQLKKYLTLVFTDQIVSKSPKFPMNLRSIKKRLFATKILVNPSSH